MLMSSGWRLTGVAMTALFLVLAVCGEAAAQKRVYARVEPNKDATDIKDSILFDVNIDPDDNIAPNILLSPDEKRGYVAYAGSGLILVFSMEDGAIVERIKTGGKPAFATLLSDKKSFAVVSVLDNKIFILDIDTNSVKATYTFANAQFGFGSLLSLSPDGKIGYISSTGTAEVIRFDIESGSETGRLKGFEAPAQITVTPDGSLLLVTETLREELVFVDAASLTQKTALKARDKESLANFTIFNKAILSPDGTTGIIASQDNNGLLGADTVFQFNASTGEILSTATIGSHPGYTTLTPDGKNWVILCEFTLNLISTEDFSVRSELSAVRGEPLGSNNILFSSDSRYAFYASSASDLIFQHDLTTNAVVGQVLVGDVPNLFLDQPSSMVMTADGKRIAVLDYVANNIELLTDAHVLNGTRLISSESEFTGLTLINLSDKTTVFTLYALNNFGELFGDEGIENPIEYVLEPNHQISFTVAQIFRFDDTIERTGWISVYADNPEIAGYVTYGDTSLTRLDGAPLLPLPPMVDWILPETLLKEGLKAEIDFVNPNFNQATYDVDRIFKDGTIDEMRVGLTAFPTNRHPQVFGEQFTLPEETTDGYLRFRSAVGLFSTEFFGSDKARGILHGINMSEFVGVKKVYAPHIAVFPGTKTTLNLINGNSEDAVVLLTVRAADGKVIAGPLRKDMHPNEQIKDDLAKLFEDYPEVADITGWLEIESDKDQIVGTASYSDTDENYLTSIVLSGKALERFLFPVIAEDPTYQTGLALLNAGDEEANVTLEIWGNGGTLDRPTTFKLGAHSRTAVYLSSYFPDLEPRLEGNLRVKSDNALHGFAIINDRALNFMTAMPPIRLP